MKCEIQKKIQSHGLKTSWNVDSIDSSVPVLKFTLQLLGNYVTSILVLIFHFSNTVICLNIIQQTADNYRNNFLILNRNMTVTTDW